MMTLDGVNIRRRLVPYVQMHEFEALLYSEPQKIVDEFSAAGLLQEIEEIVDTCGGAEAINDGYETCPSRRLSTLFPTYNKNCMVHLFVSK